MGVVCPKCGKDDQVRSVVSIITEQSLTYSDALGTLAGTGTLSSILAKRLAPPQEPKRSGVEGWVILLVLSSFFPVAYFILPFFAPIGSRMKRLFAISLLIMFLLSGGVFMLFTFMLPENLVPLVIVVMFIISIFPAIGIFIPFIGLWEEHRNRVRIYQAQLSSWNRAIEKWRKLYYCARDDGVFLEGDRLVPVEYMHVYLLGFPPGA